MRTTERDLNDEHSEYYWAKKTATEYRERGYEVETEAPLEFLPNFRADIIARKGDDKRVVEVKRRTVLRTDPMINRLAQAVEPEPGWNFDLVLIPEAMQLSAPDGSRPLGIDEALHCLSGADHLLKAGNLESSLLVAWSACEAVIRTLLEIETDVRDEVSPTSQLIDSATMHGVISHEDRDYLKQLLPLRNAVAHGMSHSDVQDAAVLGLLEFIHHVVADASSDDAEASSTP